MTATSILREDHKQIRRLERIVNKCQEKLYAGYSIPLNDLEKITFIISDFLDSIHYSREEDSYFPCVASYGHLKEEIRKFMIEHEFGRRIAFNISKHLQEWKDGKNCREPVARFLKTYAIYLNDHLSKEDSFFDHAEKNVLSKEEEKEMYEQFSSVMAISKKIGVLIKEIDYLELQDWYLE